MAIMKKVEDTRVFQWLFLIFGLSICITLASSKEIRVVCYYTNWSVYRPGTAKFSPQNINPYLCTHLIYAFGGFTKENTLKPFDKYQDIEKGGYAKFTGLKTYNKDLKTLLAIGGWNEASSRFSPMVASADRRKQLVKNSIKFLRQNNFDGLDLDWEYPAFREGGKPRDKENYAKLVQELREEFERESEKTGRTRLLLTMAVPAGIEYINKGYDIPRLTKYLDWMNILSYDYHSAFEPAVNHHAPLFPLREATEYDYDAELNIDYTIKHYLEMGADPSKLVMGIPTYGRSYTLFNPDANAIGDPADGPGEMGEATRENGYLAYYEICENVKSNEWTVVQPNDKAMGPYAYKENQWVGYDDENIARRKAEYVAQNGLGGIMFWAIDNDDFRGSCHGKPYPLIEAAKEALISASGLTDENLISPPSKAIKSKSRPRNRQKTTEEPSTEKPEAAQKTNSSRRRNRLKSKANNRVSDSDTKSKSRRNESKKAEIASTYSSLKVITPAYTTPEPPSTPDQGGAFKCEDEGFFPHPKDCKKYFWCLSGPGELGIVAHQFTCPAGLFFNKAADSCDYSQNVLCNKKLSKTTSTTEGKKNVETVKTTTERISTTAATRRTTARTTTTTEEDYDDEYEYEDEEINNGKSDSEEDPRVIKELLDLIKKAGGIEELEKQLNIDHDEVKHGVTTPSTRTKSIVEKFLTSRNTKNTSGTSKYTTINRNSRGPQNAGIEKDDDIPKKTDKKPQYTTISRKRPTQNNEETDDDQNEEKEEKSAFSKYATIRRSKEGLTIENRPIVDRNKILGEEDRDTEDSNRREVTVHTTPQYVNIRRQRPTTTTDQTSTSRYVSIRRSTTEDAVKDEEKEIPTTPRNEASESPIPERSTPSLRYQTLNRQATTTTEISTSTEPTTARELPSTQQDLITTPEMPSTTYSRSTELPSTITTEEKDGPSSSPSSTSGIISTSTSTEESKVQTTKSPVLFEPRPFSVDQKSTISTTHKPVRTNIRSTASPTKVSETTVRSRFRRPLPNKNVDNADGVSDNSVESESRSENVGTTRRTLRNKSRFTRPDVAINEDSTAPAKPAFRQRTRPLTASSTQKALSDKEQDEIQRKYRPLSLDDLSSLTAADITIQRGNREGGFRRTRLRTTTTDAPEEKSTTRRKTFERSRISSTGKSTIFSSTTEKTLIDEEQNEIRSENGSRNSEHTSESPKIITTRRRTIYRPRISVEKSSSEVNNDLTDQVKSGTDEIQLARQSRNESHSTEVTRRPPKRMRKVLKRLRTSTISPSTAAVTNRGKPLTYADLDLDVISTSEGSSSTPGIILVDADSNEASISDETIEEDENIKLSATNIRENSNINTDNAIYDIGFRKFKKAEIVFDKTRYGSKYDVVATTPTTTTTTQYSSAKTRKFIRRLRPTEPTSIKESATTKSYDESSPETKPGRSRKVIRRLRPNTKSYSNINLETSSETSQEKIAKNYRAPQFFEKRRQYFNRESIKITKDSNYNRNKFTTEDSVSTQGVYNRFGNVKDEDETSLSSETETNVETTTHRGPLRYVDIVRSTTPPVSSADNTYENEKERYKAYYFTTPHVSTLDDDSSQFSTTTNSAEITSPSQNESRETETSTQNLSDVSGTKTEETPTQFEETPQNNVYETTETTPSDITSSEYITSPAELSTLIDSKIVEDAAVSSDATGVEDISTISPENETTNLSTEDSSTLPTSFETTTPTTTTEYTRKSTLRTSRLRPTYQIRRSTSTTTKPLKENKLSDKTPKFFTRKKPSFRQKSTTESNSSQEKPSTEKPRRRYPFSKYGRLSTTVAYNDVDQLETEYSSPVYSATGTYSEENASSEKSQTSRQKLPNFFTKSTTEIYQTSTELNKSLKYDTAEKQKLRNKSLFSKKRKMNIPIYSSPEAKEESTTEHYTTLYHVFAEPEVNENETDIPYNIMKNETNVNEDGRVEPLVEINRIIEVHIKNGNDISSGVNNEAKSIFDKIGAINRVTSIQVVDGNGTKIADLPLDQTSQRLAAVHDIIAQEKKNEAISEHRKERKFDLDIKNIPNNELRNGVQRPEIIDGISHIKVITPKPILSAEVSTIALEALFSTTQKAKTEDKNSTTLAENELLDTEYSRFVNIRVIKPVDGRSLGEDEPADTPKVVKLLPSDEEVTMEAKVVEVTPKNLDQTIRIAPIQVAMARTIADTPIVGIKRLNEKISNTPFRPSLDSGEH